MVDRDLAALPHPQQVMSRLMMTSRRPRTALFAAALALVAGVTVLTSISGAQGASCMGHAATIVAQPGVTTVGTPGNDVIVGTEGDDVIRGRGGDDIICAGGGNDRVFAGYGRDTVDLGSGDDFSKGGPGHDVISGGLGNDLIRGRSGHDSIHGDDGVDTCYGGKGRDSVQSCNEPASPPPSAPTLSAQEREMVELVQELRAEYGAGALEVSVSISEVARDWSVELPSGFHHNPSVGNQIPGGWRMWGENIAYNRSVQAAFDALVNSSGHFRNMVNPDFTHLGVGVYVDGGRVYVTQVFARY